MGEASDVFSAFTLRVEGRATGGNRLCGILLAERVNDNFVVISALICIITNERCAFQVSIFDIAVYRKNVNEK